MQASFGETGWFERGRRPFVKKCNSHLWNLWCHLLATYLSSLSQPFHTNSHPWSQSLQQLQQLTSDTQCDIIVYIEVKCRESPLSTTVGSETSWTSENNIQETKTNVLWVIFRDMHIGFRFKQKHKLTSRLQGNLSYECVDLKWTPPGIFLN